LASEFAQDAGRADGSQSATGAPLVVRWLNHDRGLIVEGPVTDVLAVLIPVWAFTLTGVMLELAVEPEKIWIDCTPAWQSY
jgi:hypothetical protein